MDYSREHNIKKMRGSKTNALKTRNKILLIAARVAFALVLISGFAVSGAVVGAYMGVIENAPRMEAIAIMPSIYPSIIVDANGVEITRLSGEENREYVTLDRIPLHLQQAFIAIEDERFFYHNGVDIRGMFRALRNNFTTNRTEGASTITQQIIKNNVRGIGRNTLGTKIQEIYLAVMYERELAELLGSREAAKYHILEVYLNTINLHHRLNGVMTAARYYFDKDVSELTLSESAVIASITQNPSRFSPLNNPENNRQRKLLVLGNMLRLGFITQEEHDYAAADSEVYNRIIANERITEQRNSIHSYFDDALIQQVVDHLIRDFAISREEAFFWIYNGGLRIYSTQDLAMQEIMYEAFLDDNLFPSIGFRIDIQYFLTVRNILTGREEHHERRDTVQRADQIDGFVQNTRDSILRNNEEIVSERVIPIPQPQAAMVVMDWRNGFVKAITGGRGEKMLNLALNRATDSARQPGSVFKTLASFVPAIDMGRASAATIVNDTLFTYNGYTPSNWYEGFWGPSSLRRAMAQSMNVVSVKTMIDTGIEESFRYVQNFGFTTLVSPEEALIRGNQVFHDMVPSLPLGGLTFGVTQLEVTAAFAAIANNGMYNYPMFYSRVLDQEGRVLLEANPVNRSVMRPQAAYIITDMMRDTMTVGTGTAARLRNTNIPVSGKTGTTQNAHDLLFVGYTPYLAAGIWMGYDQPAPIPRGTHHSHLHLWRAVMEGIHEGLEFRDFERPEGVVRGTIPGGRGAADLIILGDTPYAVLPISGGRLGQHTEFGSGQTEYDEYGNLVTPSEDEPLEILGPDLDYTEIPPGLEIFFPSPPAEDTTPSNGAVTSPPGNVPTTPPPTVPNFTPPPGIPGTPPPTVPIPTAPPPTVPMPAPSPLPTVPPAIIEPQPESPEDTPYVDMPLSLSDFGV